MTKETKLKKNNYKYYTLLFLLIVFVNNSFTQSNINIEDIIENILETSETEEYDFDTYFEIFSYFSENPINLNKATHEELAELHILSSLQINNLLNYVESERKLITIYELQAVPNFDLNTIYNILPFVRVTGNIEDFHVPMKKLVINGTHQFFIRYTQQFPLKNGFLKDENDNSRFKGDPTKLYFRYKYNFSNKLSYGITAEKDAYEEFFKGSNKQGFDFYSAHVFFKTNTIFKEVAIGDYHLKLGQGLLAWTGFATGKSSYTMQVKKTGSILKAYTSVDEYRFFRGIASTIKVNNFSATPFFSIKNVDANISYSDSLEKEIETLSLQTFGLHRTNSEIEDKNQLLEIKFGANMQYGKKDRRIGVNIMHTQYNKEIIQKIKAYNQFKLLGKSYTNASIDYSYLIGTFHFFGENALSFTQKDKYKLGYALLNGLMFSADKKVDFSLVHRYYDKRFVTSITADGFGESTTPNNEHGLYLGTEIRPLKKVKINAYVDIYKFPWLRFSTKAPSFGRDFLAQISYKPKRGFEIYFRYKNEKKLQNTKIKFEDEYALVTENNLSLFTNYFKGVEFEEDDLGRKIIKSNNTVSKDKLQNAKFITNHYTQKFRLNARYVLDKTWTFQTRIESSIYDDEINGVKYGFMAFQDVKFKMLSIPVSFNLRLAYFDVQDWGARIYAYENDVLYQFSVPAFNNRGVRTYLNIRYRIIKGIDFWLKISNTHYTNISTISSGANSINGNNLTELKTQLRFKF